MMQASPKLFTAIWANNEDLTRALWLDNSLTAVERARALYYALLMGRGSIVEWLLYHLDMPVATAQALLEASGMMTQGVSYGKLLLSIARYQPSE